MLAPQADKPGLLVTTTAFGDYELKFEYQMSRTGSGSVPASVMVLVSSSSLRPAPFRCN